MNPTSQETSTPGQDALADTIRWDAQGLVPAVVQDDLSGQVLMLAYMNREALRLTLESGEVHFWSRSRKALWRKGETSGNVLSVSAIHVDCDGDALLLLVDPAGPACHTGEKTCFHRRLDGDIDMEAQPFRSRLFSLLRDRKAHPKPGSYTSQLLKSGESRLLQKLGEEAVETIVAAQAEGEDRLIAEAADLMYHLILLLVNRDLPLEVVDRELRHRYVGR